MTMETRGCLSRKLEAHKKKLAKGVEAKSRKLKEGKKG